MTPIEPSKLFSELSNSQTLPNKELELDELDQNKTILQKKKAQDRILSAEDQQTTSSGAEVSSDNLRPASLNEYIGQERLKQILKIGIEAAINRGDRSSIGHILLYGAPGLGKTSCAFLLAKLIGSQAHIFSAPSLDKPKDIVGVLMSLQEGDVVFIDEIHRLNKITEELLYTAMEDFVLDLSTGKGVSARVTRLPLPKFVLVGATTKLGNISAPMRDRFTHVHKMEFYSPEELATIAVRTAKILDFELTQAASLIVAERSRGTPRIANRQCRMVRDYLHHKKLQLADEELVRETLDLFRIDENGLDQTDRQMLRIIIENYNGGPVGLDTLAVTLGEDSRTLEDYYEPFLIQAGFLERTPKGRKASSKAYALLGLEDLQMKLS
jgi:holliday junction DNA helicase RuvB